MNTGALKFRLTALLLAPVLLLHSDLAIAKESQDGVPRVCRVIADAANHGDLQLLLVASRDDDSVPKPEGPWSFDYKGRVDINGDGALEYVYVATPDSGGYRSLVVYDESGDELSIRNHPSYYWESDSIRWGGAKSVVAFEGEYFLLAANGKRLSYVSQIGPDNANEVICEFAQRDTPEGSPDTRVVNYVLTEYEAFTRLAESYYRGPWELAFFDGDLDRAGMLLRNGHTANDRVGRSPHSPHLLIWAVTHSRPEIVGWLLERGADPNIGLGENGQGTPLSRHLFSGEGSAIALRLLEAGADASGLVEEVISFAERSAPEEATPVVLAALSQWPYIPSGLITYAIEGNNALIGRLEALDLPVETRARERHEGRPVEIPLHVRGALRLAGLDGSSVAAATGRLYGGSTYYAPDTSAAIMSYGDPEDGMAVRRYQYSETSDEELLLFATGMCIYFFPTECGPAELVQRAGAWSEQLPDECPPDLVGSLEGTACSLVAHYIRLAGTRMDAAVLIYPVSLDTLRTGMPFTTASDLVTMYRAKHGLSKDRLNGN